MKGRTRCPECKHEFVLDVPNDENKHDVICPNCENKFTIKAKPCKTGSEKECFWEEHGEPRKTILSSIKPKTTKPKIAAIILICVFVLGITTAVFSETFIETSLDIASSAGIKVTMKINIINETNQSINTLTVVVEGVDNIEKTGDGVYTAKNVKPGIKKIKVFGTNYTTFTREVIVAPFFTSEHDIKMVKGSGSKINDFDESGCSLIIIIFSIFALLGAVSCFKRIHYDVAIAGSIISIFSFGFFMIGSILAIIAFIIIFKCKEEFKNGKKGKTF